MTSSGRLRRELGTFGAMMMGLGSILGTGVFVSLGVGAGIAGPAVVLAIALAAFVAICNGLSSAQLAANHPVSGGTYEYGYRVLTPGFGFTAGWMFLAAKSASAATAALGFAGYALNTVEADRRWLVPTALAVVVVLTVIVLTGMRLSSAVNIVIVTVTLASLGFFIIAGLPAVGRQGTSSFTPWFGDEALGHAGGVTGALLHASALMFVAYTGYGRIATLGEEVREPRRTIPRAVILTLVVSMLVYVGVATVAVGAAGAPAFASATADEAAPLEVIARTHFFAGAGWVLAIGAITAMVGVLLNLILGLSRVLLAMGRRRDMPAAVARIDRGGTTPWVAVIVMGAVIAGLVLIGDVRTTWTFSAFTVLVYYSITNLAALRLPREQIMFPRWVAAAGLLACLLLAFAVPVRIWAAGLGVLAVGWAWRVTWRLMARRTAAV